MIFVETDAHKTGMEGPSPPLDLFRLLAVLYGETESICYLHINSVITTAAGASSQNSYQTVQL